MRNMIKKIWVLMLISLFAFGFVSTGNRHALIGQPLDYFNHFDDHRFQEMPDLVIPDETYMNYTTFRTSVGNTSTNILAINPDTWGKIIRIDTAEELYRFSVDVSYNLKYTPFETKLSSQAISRLLSLHYVLGNDIDYSIMKSKQFNPIGYDFIMNGVHHVNYFTGIFDGQGFEITNLYFSGFEQLIEILYEGTDIETEIAYTAYYTMFAYNNGVIRNFGLINPTYEFYYESTELNKAAYLVGKNDTDGHVHHVYAIDTRTALVGGIRMLVTTGQASGVMFENHGTFHDAYFAGRVVINGSFGSRFQAQPVLFSNHASGTIEGLAFDDTLYQEVVTVGGSSYTIQTPNTLATSMTTQALRSSNTVLGSGWYFYPAQNQPIAKYPTVMGLQLSTTPISISLSSDPTDQVTLTSHMVIENALDLIAFSKILNYNRQVGATPFRELNYVIHQSIDMSMVAPNAYVTPSVEFSGVFAGVHSSIYIKGLNIKNGDGQLTYNAGLINTLTGSVLNLIFYEATLLMTETDLYAGVPNYVGLIAGQMRSGTIRNVLADVQINLGSKTLGEFYVGGLVGEATGWIESVYVEGLLESNQDHVYNTGILIKAEYHIGGLVGASGTEAPLTLIDGFNQMDLRGPGTTSTQMTVSSGPVVYMGGIIGKVTNQANAVHTLGLLTNHGQLDVHFLRSQHATTWYAGGIVGLSGGIAYQINQYSGKLRNFGVIDVMNRGTNQVVASGILVSNHTQPTEFVHLYNQSSGTLRYFTPSPQTGTFQNISYTTLVYNLGQGLTLSQSKNEADFELIESFNFSGLYHSTQNALSLLRFVENRGSILLRNRTLTQTVNLAGITLSTNVDYLNVTYQGQIEAINLVMETNTTTNKELFVAGITHTLTQSRSIQNSIVNGSITVGGISTNLVNRTPRNNIYIGGFVIYNNSGNMDPNGTTLMPKATMGILNSINNADITSTYSPSVFGILGHANVYAGGIAAFNDGDIQDSVNFGDLRFENRSNVDTTNVTFNLAATAGGSSTKYRYGVVLGGIASSVLSQKSRIYDSANNGTIIALSRNFARAGGILGIAIFLELQTGNAPTIYTSATNANIQASILSNCINYGNVSALTVSISEYSSGNTNQSLYHGTYNHIFRFDITQPVIVSGYQNSFYSTVSNNAPTISTRTSTQERPGIHASAGGVIGYGLSVMRRMMNHGEISSTDVAGGVVGATVVFLTEYVKIDTAVNYGRVRAFNRGTNNAQFSAVDIMDYETIRDYFYPVDSTFIFPNTRSDIRLFPEDKRGFGGIFGRLQRAANQIMYGNNDNNSTFNFIVNMDPNVDLIGRLDQVYNYFSSLHFFDFRNATYYSARKNDTTQAVFTGISYFYDNSSTVGNSLFATRTNANIQITSQKYEYQYDSQSGQWMRTTYQRTMSRTEIVLYGRRYTKVGRETAPFVNYQSEVISRSTGPAHNSTGWTALAGSTVPAGTLNEYKYLHQLPYYNQVWDLEETKVTISSTTTQVPNGYYLWATTLPVPVITEDPMDAFGEFTYGPTFPMITDPTLQDFIYYAENGNLSNTFINARPYGMYVLSTSSGSTFGANLPRNLVFDRLLPLAPSESGGLPSHSVDYVNAPRMSVNDNPDYQDLLANYAKMFQTQFSDKSQLLDSQPTIALHEIEGSKTKLLNPTLLQPTGSSNLGTLTFNLHLGNVDLSSGGIITLDYEMIQAMLPDNAILAKTIEAFYGLPYGSDVSAYVASYRALLAQYADPTIPDDQKPDLKPELTLQVNASNPQSGIFNIGYVTSYSQLSYNITAFLTDDYTTDYLIRINVTYDPNFTKPFLYRYRVDGGSLLTPPSGTHISQTVTNTLEFNFRNPQQVLPHGTDFLSLGSDVADNVELHYFDPITNDYVMVDYSDYQITATPVQNATNFPFTFTLILNPQLRGGLYRVGYRMLPYEAIKEGYTFNKAASTLRAVTELEHYSSGKINPVSTSIQSWVNFGYDFDFSSTLPMTTEIPNQKPYLDAVISYHLPFLNYLKISSFATITNVAINNTTFTAQGYRIYNISYSVRSESGLTTVYTHQITERPIAITDVFRNNNKVVMNASNPVLISREALSTTVSINYAVDRNYSSEIYNLIDDNPNRYFAITPFVEGVLFSVTDNSLVFTIDYEVDAGDYEFNVYYVRPGDPQIDLGKVYIRKLQGTNAYLFDISFAELATETNYPLMYVSNASGVPISSSFQPTVYYAGIDYDGANLNGITQFRIDGQVSNIPLNNYLPLFLNHLPAGATIARKIDSSTWTQEISGPDDPNLGVLAADFSAGFDENEDVIVTYRVTSENGLSQVYYHITVTDITYNVSLIFDVIYEGNALMPNLDGLVVVINVRNMKTNLPVGDVPVETFPAFNRIDEYRNSTNLMYVLNHDNYQFRFGRNLSGFFSFNIKVLDPNNYKYDFKIELDGTFELPNVSDYDDSTNDSGKYYYINSSTRNRTRSFVLTIFNAQTPEREYGFTDKDASWGPTDYHFGFMNLNQIFVEGGSAVGPQFTQSDGAISSAGGTLYVPNLRTYYTIETRAQIVTPGTGGGFGIFFDSAVTNLNAVSDTGFVLQFDRAYATGEITIRPRSNGSELSPVFRFPVGFDSSGNFVTSGGTKDNTNPWWTEVHDIRIVIARHTHVTNNKSISVYVDGVFLFTYYYQSSNMGSQTNSSYTGFRTWGGVRTEFYYLRIT